MTQFRTYNCNVLVANWFEDQVLREEQLKDFLYKKERGLLITQRIAQIFGLRADGPKIVTSACEDGLLHSGDQIQLMNPGASAVHVRTNRAPPRDPTCLATSIPASYLQLGAARNSKQNDSDGGEVENQFDRINAVASCDTQPSSLNILRVIRAADAQEKVEDAATPESHTTISASSSSAATSPPESSANGTQICYGDAFYLTSCGQPPYYLRSEARNFSTAARYSRQQEVSMHSKPDNATLWRCEYLLPAERDQMHGQPIKVNQPVLIKHVRTGNNLSLEPKFVSKNISGVETEISCATYLDDHKFEKDVSHWVFTSSQQPGV